MANQGKSVVEEDADRASKDLLIDSLDLIFAREVERILFPKSLPVCTWQCIEAKNSMDGVLGGDYFDFISLPDSSQITFIRDVTGHGLHAFWTEKRGESRIKLQKIKSLTVLPGTTALASP